MPLDVETQKIIRRGHIIRNGNQALPHVPEKRDISRVTKLPKCRSKVPPCLTAEFGISLGDLALVNPASDFNHREKITLEGGTRSTRLNRQKGGPPVEIILQLVADPAQARWFVQRRAQRHIRQFAAQRGLKNLSFAFHP